MKLNEPRAYRTPMSQLRCKSLSLYSNPIECNSPVQHVLPKVLLAVWVLLTVYLQTTMIDRFVHACRCTVLWWHVRGVAFACKYLCVCCCVRSSRAVHVFFRWTHSIPSVLRKASLSSMSTILAVQQRLKKLRFRRHRAKLACGNANTHVGGIPRLNVNESPFALVHTLQYLPITGLSHETKPRKGQTL